MAALLPLAIALHAEALTERKNPCNDPSRRGVGRCDLRAFGGNGDWAAGT